MHGTPPNPPPNDPRKLNAESLHLDYFLFYRVDSQTVDHRVELRGQFDDRPQRARLTRVRRFGNRVSKNDESLFDPTANLTFYGFQQGGSESDRQIRIRDQFGTRRLIVQESAALLVPTGWGKVPGEVGIPEGLDHYKVYKVAAGSKVSKVVKLHDRLGATEARVLSPKYFAVPAEKIHQGESFPIHNEVAHLVLYEAASYTRKQNIQTRDQFASRVLSIVKSDLLAVPCLKIELP